MFTNFSTAEQEIRFPKDRRMFINIKPNALVVLGIIVLATIGLAWFQYLVFGLPRDPPLSLPTITPTDPNGYPLWLRLSHWVNFFFLVLIIRSGLSILADHARLYWNNGCAPDSEWLRFTR